MSIGSTKPGSGAARFSRDVAMTFGARLFIAAGSFLGGVIVARWLGAASVGVLASLNVIALLAVTFGGFGLSSATTYIVASDKKHVNHAIVNAFVFAALIGGLLSGLIIALYRLYPGLFGDVPGTLVFITATIVPFQLLGLLSLSTLLGLGRIGLYNLFDMATPASLVISPIVLLIGIGAGLTALVSVNALAVVLLSLVVLTAVVRIAGGRRQDWTFDVALLKETLRHGSRFYIAMIAAVIIMRADLLIVNYFKGAAEAGVYAIATQIGTLLMLVPTVISTVLFPRATEAGEAGAEITSRVTRHVVLIMVITCSGAIPLAFVLPLIFGVAFEPASLQVLILLPGIFLFAVESVLVQYFSSIGLPRAIPSFWIVTLIINVGLDLAFVPRYGALAAAAVSSISYALIFAFVAFYFSRVTGIGLGRTLLISSSEVKDLLNLRAFAAAPGE
jgi:O-antigen/teichoic acid export membrane protein